MQLVLTHTTTSRLTHSITQAREGERSLMNIRLLTHVALCGLLVTSASGASQSSGLSLTLSTHVTHRMSAPGARSQQKTVHLSCMGRADKLRCRPCRDRHLLQLYAEIVISHAHADERLASMAAASRV